MKYQTVIDPNGEELVKIYARERTPLVEQLEQLLQQSMQELIGYEGPCIYSFSPADADCFVVEDGKVYALWQGKRLHVRERLYRVEQLVGEQFIRINQSCLANVKRIERFETSFAGALLVVFRGGHRDYVSRRQLKFVKERMGFRL